jgi:anti-sigma factor RsiW
MNCSDVRGLAGNYIDDELPDEVHDRIQRHLLKCAGCQREVSTLGGAVRALRTAVPTAAPHPAFIQAALEKLSEELNVTNTLPAASGQLVLGIGSE